MPAEKPDTMLRTRLLQNRDPHYQPTTTEKLTLEPEETKKTKKTVLGDFKKLALKLKLEPGSYVLHLQTRKDDTGKTSSAPQPVTPTVTLETSPEAALRRVFQTNELLEMIVSYLPMKKIVNVQRVAKQWKNVIAGSPRIQEKLFARRENKAQEIWVLVKYKPARGRLRDKLHRVENLPAPGNWVITPVTLNPMLHEARSWLNPNALVYPVSMMPSRVSVNFCAWANAFRYEESCMRNMFITDPPCTNVTIEYLIVYLGFPETRLQHPKPDYFDHNHPKQDGFSVRISGIAVESTSGLTMLDIFRAAMHNRGNARLTLTDGSYHERSNATIHEIIAFLMQTSGWTSIPESPFMELSLGLATLGSTSIIIATDGERETANEPWKLSDKPAYKF